LTLSNWQHPITSPFLGEQPPLSTALCPESLNKGEAADPSTKGENSVYDVRFSSDRRPYESENLNAVAQSVRKLA
jgi:hypothetical protein